MNRHEYHNRQIPALDFIVSLSYNLLSVIEKKQLAFISIISENAVQPNSSMKTAHPERKAMTNEMPKHGAVPALLASQLIAAEVYAHYLDMSSGGEADFWKKLLQDELDHIAHLAPLLNQELSSTIALPAANYGRIQEVRQLVVCNRDLYLMRLEGALRLECAELDYGLEGVVARQLKNHTPFFDYPGDIIDHISWLLNEANRYAESPNIGLQIRRLNELLDTCLDNHPMSGETETQSPLR